MTLQQSKGKLAIVLPRGTSFGPKRATSIDLCVHDFVTHSRYAGSTQIHATRVEQPFPGVDLRFDAGGWGGQMGKAFRIARRIRSDCADLTVVHQHLPSAFILSKTLPHPVLLHAHNFHKGMSPSVQRFLKHWRYSSLAGLIFVSEVCRTDFKKKWPDVAVPTFVVHNGLDLSLWHPAPEKRNRILIVARAAPDKGVLEAAQALQGTLPRLPGWTALMILSEVDRYPEYYAQVRDLVKASNGAIEIMTSQPHEFVRKATEESEIALVPSKWDEPFGRTAIEAHAGGAALISSGRGGLREVSGDACLYIDPDDSGAVAATIIKLATDDPFRRSLADRGRERVSTYYDIRKVCCNLDDIYDKYLKSGT